MKNDLSRVSVVGAVLVALSLTVPQLASAQSPASAPATTQKADSTTAEVVKVAGNVQAAPVDAEGKATQWQPVKVGDRLAAGMQVRTALRSSLLLQFGDNVIVKIDRATSATIAQFHRTATQQKVKLDVGYGAVRAGVAEGSLESDMSIETPVATLTRRGTWDFGIEYEAGTGRFRIFLADRGLVEALNQLTQQRRTLLGGQYVTQMMIRWIETTKFDHYIPVQDWAGLTGADLVFCQMNDSGRSVVSPGGGLGIMNISGAGGNGQNGQQFFQDMPDITIPPIGPTRIDRPEGNFGTGGGGVLPKSTK